MDKTLLQQLNRIYAPMQNRARRLTQALTKRGLNARWGWYANHSIRVDCAYQTEEFPIPVVEVGNLCEIGLDLDCCWLEFQLPRTLALTIDWARLPECAEVYGVENYLLDFYHEGMNLSEIAERISKSAEQDVNVALFFPENVEDVVLLAAVEDCHRLKQV